MRKEISVRRPMVEALAERWWIPVLRGVFSVLLGIAAFAWPGITLTFLAVAWGALAFADGVMAVALSGLTRSWSLLFVGLVGIAAGVYTFFRPGMTVLTLVFVVGVWAVVRGVFDIVEAITLRKEIPHEWLMLFGGVVAVIFGIVVVMAPGMGALSIAWVIGVYAIVHGLLLLTVGLRVRKLDHLIKTAATALA